MGYSEITLQSKFIDCGFNIKFELLGSNGVGRQSTKFIVKCKECNCEFEESQVVLRREPKKLTCRKCGVSTDGSYNMMCRLEYLNAREYYEAGHSVKETAEKFNTTKNTINNWVKKNNLSNGTSFREGGNKSNKKRHEEITKKTITGTKKHSHRAIKYGCKFETGISLKKIIKRDGMICKICGLKCDISDDAWGRTGPLYPSIDHIIPISKGGGHTWDNVQITHIICNSKKGATVI